MTRDYGCTEGIEPRVRFSIKAAGIGAKDVRLAKQREILKDSP